MVQGKKKKLRSNVGSSEDRISELPNSVIHIIFSFLDTKLAVQTCVLSKRWRNVWTSLPYLQFNAKSKRRAKSYINFIQQVLLRRDSCPVKKLCLESSSDILTETLLSYAVQHQVQNLKLKVHYEAIHLPVCFNLASNSIEVLELAGVAFETTINWIKLSHLSSLKTLHISWLKDFDGRFLSSCPNLENLKIIDLNNTMGKEFNIHSLSLKTLEIHSFLDIVCSFMVPKLTHFKYCSWYPMLLSVKSSICLQVLDIVMTQVLSSDVGRGSEYFERLINMFKAFRNAKSIVLYPITVKVLSASSDYLKEHPLSFPRLKYLRLRAMNHDFNVPASVLLYFVNSSTTISVSKQ